MKKNLYCLDISVWDADDYVNERCCDPKWHSYFLFESEQEARQWAKNDMNLTISPEIYNEAILCRAELNEADILEAAGVDAMDEIDINLNNHDCSLNDLKKLAELVIENDGFGQNIECANYDFSKTIAGSILVCWQWEPYVGYARKCREVRRAEDWETEELLTKADRTFTPQWDVLCTAQEIDGLSDEDFRTLVHQHLDEAKWKWRNDAHSIADEALFNDAD